MIMQENKQVKSPIKSRMLQYIKEKGITRYAFYKETGMSRGILDQPTGISEDNLACFIKYAPEVSLEWLICGQGEMIDKKASSSVVYETPGQKTPRASDFSQKYVTEETKGKDEKIISRIPFYDIESVDDLKLLFEHRDVSPSVKYISIPDIPSCDGAIKLSGDAMYPMFRSGDVVLYKWIRNFSCIVWGELYLVSFMNEDEEYTTIRRLDGVDGDRQMVKLVGCDRQYAPLIIPLSSIRALALIKASIRYHTMK